jgi:hypothetical protein
MGGRWPADAPLVDPLEGRSQARARFAVSQATPAGLIRAQAEAYRNRGWPQYKEFLAGRGSGATMIHILETLMRLGQRLGYDTAHFRRQHWDLMAEVVAIYEVRYANGRLTIQDVQDVRQELLRTALDLRQVPAQVLPPRDEPPFLLSAEAWRPATDLAEEHQRAHQRQEAWEGDPVILRRRLRDLARDEWQASWQEFQKNRGSVSSLLDAARKELEAGLALVAEPIGRQQLREQYWRRTWEVEHLGERFYDLGRFSIQELLDVRYHRLRAEWELK